jgi:hypothetical protein
MLVASVRREPSHYCRVSTISRRRVYWCSRDRERSRRDGTSEGHTPIADRREGVGPLDDPE